MEIYLIRHTPVAVGKDTCYGQSNVPLADTFLQDAEALKNKLPNDFDVVFCSPLDRCKELATYLNCGEVHFDNNLMEMNFGDWENLKWNDINQTDLNNWMNDFVHVSTPNGENLTTLFQRVSTFANNLRKQSLKKVLIITHAGVLRCMWSYILEIPLQNIFKIPIGHSEIFVVKLGTDKKLDSIKKFI